MNRVEIILAMALSIPVVASAQAPPEHSSERLSMPSLPITANPRVIAFAHLTPHAYAHVSTRSVVTDGEPVSLTRYERSDGRGVGLGGEHFSLVVSDAGILKGFTRMDLAMVDGQLPSREHARATALRFLQKEAPDLLQRMEISWIEPHDEIIQTTCGGRPATVTLAGMKVKARNLVDGRWFWVIVGANDSVMVFERDIVWVTFPGHRKTEKWLHDAWLVERARKQR